ncbi:TetR/AcrR family transcriptional regulator [Tsuneonella sp. HG094]
MRYDADHKAGSRARILKSAAKQIRARGPEKVAVSEVMSAAGLTHGAFYAHFVSKDELVAEAIVVMFAEAADRSGGLKDLATFEGDDLRIGLRSYLEGYLSPSHRDRPDRGCPLPALAADIARVDNLVRQNFLAGMERMTSRIEEALERLGRANAGADARATVAQMVGALGLARAMRSDTRSDTMLRDCLDTIIERLSL